VKRLLLINTNTEKAPYPVPPLGLSLLAAALQDKYEVFIWDGMFKKADGLPEFVQEWHPDFIGFSIRNIDDILIDRVIFYVEEIVKDFIEPVKKVSSAPVILGGSGFSIFPGELMELTGADYGVAGEGEEVLEKLLSHLDRNETGFNIPNVLKKGASVRKDPAKATHADLASIPYAEIDRRIDFSPYMGKGVYSIQTKRGCSHGCIYCTYPLIEGKYFRIRPAEEVAKEIAQVYKRLGTITVEFVDSTFNDPAGHAEAICREIIKTKVRMRFRTMGINPRHASRELFELMKEAGFAQIDATPDTASPSVLKIMKKGFLLKDIIHTAEMIRKAEMPTMWFFLFGGPGETEETVKETFNFIDDHINPDDMVFMSGGLRIYPGTPLYRISVKEGKIREGVSLLNPSPYYFSDMTPRTKLNELLRKASETRPNCILGAESTPPPEMLEEAVRYRQETGVDEPMFRTLLRIRRRWFTGREV
jgi:radical SAM superfamily enzyme YgiQ (UPF0313 family)